MSPHYSRFLATLFLTTSFLGGVTAKASQHSLDCVSEPELFYVKITYSSAKKIDSASISIKNDSNQELELISADEVSAQDLRPGVPGLGDLANSAMKEFVFTEDHLTVAGKKVLPGFPFSEISVAAMAGGSSSDPLANFLVLVRGGAVGEGKMLSLDCN